MTSRHHYDMTTYPDNAIRGPCDNDVILVPLKQLQGSIHNTSKWLNQPYQTHTYTHTHTHTHTHIHTHTHTHTYTYTL